MPFVEPILTIPSARISTVRNLVTHFAHYEYLIDAVTSCATAFYSENNLNALAQELGHDGIRTILNELQANAQMRMTVSVDATKLKRDGDPSSVLKQFSAQARHAYIKCKLTWAAEVGPLANKITSNSSIL